MCLCGMQPKPDNRTFSLLPSSIRAPPPVSHTPNLLLQLRSEVSYIPKAVQKLEHVDAWFKPDPKNRDALYALLADHDRLSSNTSRYRPNRRPIVGFSRCEAL